MGCINSSSIGGTATMEGTSIAVQVCLNSQCTSATLDTTTDNCASVGGGDVCLEAFGSTWRVSGDVNPGQAGDRCFVKITDATTGTVLGSGSAQTKNDYPNGPSCAPVCRDLVVTVSPS